MFPPPWSQNQCPPYYMHILHTRVHTHAHTDTRNLHCSLDLLTIQKRLGPPPFYTLLKSPTSGVGQSLKAPQGKFLVPPKINVPFCHILESKRNLKWPDNHLWRCKTLYVYHFVPVQSLYISKYPELISSFLSLSLLDQDAPLCFTMWVCLCEPNLFFLELLRHQ